jgi:hypothetical protein
MGKGKGKGGSSGSSNADRACGKAWKKLKRDGTSGRGKTTGRTSGGYLTDGPKADKALRWDTDTYRAERRSRRKVARAERRKAAQSSVGASRKRKGTSPE